MKKCILFSIVCLSFFNYGWSQSFTKRIVFFSDKNETPYTLTNPSAYLSSRAVQRRIKYNINIDSTDLPVVPRYIDSILNAGTVTILGRSKWLNAVIIQTSDANAIAKINAFPFVKSLSNIALRTVPGIPKDKFSSLSSPTSSPAKTEKLLADTFDYGPAANQIKIHKGEFLHNLGARGKGMVMAFFDAGFTGFQTNRFFDSARSRNQFLGTWDFVSNNANVNEDHPHGLNCFSIVGGYIPGTFVGSSPEAGYYLLRTEDAPTEQVIEEYNWAIAAEYADSAGVDVISSSLGYSTFDNSAFNHTYADMNGNTTVVTRMADLASKKGILVVSSAGNEGSSSWRYISAPADGDSVFTIGAVNNSGFIANFSSFGPTSNGRIKPDVVSVGQGTVLISTSGNVTNSSGTSFSCPNMAGLATCLWQLFPEVNNYKIITTLRKSSDRFNSPDPQYGYGLPDMKKAVGFLLGDVSAMNASLTNCNATINWNSKDKAGMIYYIERKLPGESTYTRVKTIEATEPVFGARNYQVTDVLNSSSAGNVSYRILQVVDPANELAETYALDSAVVTLPAPCTTSNIRDLFDPTQRIQLFPNPVSSTVQLKFFDAAGLSNLMIQIFNLQNQLVWQQAYNKPNGVVTYSLPVSSLQKGPYILVVKQNGRNYTVKEFVKQ